MARLYPAPDGGYEGEDYTGDYRSLERMAGLDFEYALGGLGTYTRSGCGGHSGQALPQPSQQGPPNGGVQRREWFRASLAGSFLGLSRVGVP